VGRRAQGERVDPVEAPRLFELLCGLLRRLRAPPVDEVVITSEFNASVMQVSRLGLFGRRRTFLLLGLPLMKSLTVEQFAAVLAHELGHLACGHGRVNPAHRIRRLWARLEATFQQTGSAGASSSARRPASFPVARDNEFEADAVAAQLTSPRGAAQALTNVSIIGGYLEQRYWPAVYAAARESPGCEVAPFSGFTPQAIGGMSAAQLRRWQDSALARQTAVCDTHPSLGDRLEALGESAEFAPLPGKTVVRPRRSLSFRRIPS
jgi:Zn-dependent protease with chaperone function